MPQTVEELKRLQFGIEAAGIGFWEVELSDNSMKWDERCKEIFGLPKDYDLPYTDALRYIHSDDVAYVTEAIQDALSGKNGGIYDARYRTIGGIDGKLRWVHFSGRAYFNEKKEPVRFGGIAQDITQIQTIVHKTETDLQESEDRFRSIFEQAPLAIGLFRGRDMIIETGNDAIFNLWGKSRSVIGLTVLEAIPEIRGMGFLELLQGVYDTGVPFVGIDVLINLVRNGQLQECYFDFTYTAVRAGGVITGVMVLATEVTPQAIAQKALKASERKLRDVISAAPTGMVLFMGEDLVVEMPNQAFLEMASVGREITGKPLREAMPELNEQPFMKILQNVYATGQRYENTMQADIIRNDVLTPHYFDFSYTPLFDAEGKVYAILDISVDVTKEMETRKQIEESEAFMRQAVELAELATWSIEIPTRQLWYSDRMYAWQGIDPGVEKLENVLMIIAPEDRQRVAEALDRATTQDSDGNFNEEYTVIHRETGRKRVLHSQGKVLLDEEGEPMKMIGTSQDITVQREMQLALEQEVQQRTEELDVINEELQAANEELNVTNEELAELNENLVNSNQDLQQFAHVASHDLKEPLRKIKIFLSRLEDDQGNVLTGRSLSFMDKMRVSADRMFSMIDGVLTYSKLNSEEQYLQSVDINDIITHILIDLEVPIANKKAVIDYQNLPVIDGASILIYQLFYNLIINSLKFSREGVPVTIKIRSTFMDIKKVRFCRIELADNGIGFDQKLADKIFGTFVRLNSKDQFEGTGLGLALCRKIVQRHHGMIEASGEVGKGATFIIHLPVKHLYISI
jgi:PAS domain S-box-containing protein